MLGLFYFTTINIGKVNFNEVYLQYHKICNLYTLYILRPPQTHSSGRNVSSKTVRKWTKQLKPREEIK